MERSITLELIIVIIIIAVGYYVYRDIASKKAKSNTNTNTNNSKSVSVKTLAQEMDEIIAANPVDMGILISYDIKKTYVIGYYRDGYVYTDKGGTPIGSYNQKEFLFDDNVIGWYMGGSIYVWHNYPNNSERIAEIFEGQNFICPEGSVSNNPYKTVYFTNLKDPIGAAAAYVILRFGWGAYSEETKRFFMN